MIYVILALYTWSGELGLLLHFLTFGADHLRKSISLIFGTDRNKVKSEELSCSFNIQGSKFTKVLACCLSGCFEIDWNSYSRGGINRNLSCRI